MKREKNNPSQERKLSLEETRTANERIDKLLPIIADTILGAGGEDEIKAPLWPLHTHRGLLYWGKEWTNDLHSAISKLNQKGIPVSEAAQLFIHSSRIAQSLWRLDAIKQTDLNKEEKLYAVARLFDYLAIFRDDNLFCESGQNSILAPEEVEKLIEAASFTDLSKAEGLKPLVSRFQGMLWAYTELIYWTNHPFGHSFHGPYETGKGVLLVREYFDLKPKTWPFAQKLGFDKATFFEIYEPGTELALDFFERGVRSIKPYRERLKAVAIKVGDRAITSREELEECLNNLEVVSEKGSDFINSLKDQKIIAKHAEMWWYVLKPVFEAVGKDWRPPKAVHDNIYNRFEELEGVWQKMQKRPKPKNLEEARKNIRQAFDFRL